MHVTRGGVLNIALVEHGKIVEGYVHFRSGTGTIQDPFVLGSEVELYRAMEEAKDREEGLGRRIEVKMTEQYEKLRGDIAKIGERLEGLERDMAPINEFRTGIRRHLIKFVAAFIVGTTSVGTLWHLVSVWFTGGAGK